MAVGCTAVLTGLGDAVALLLGRRLVGCLNSGGTKGQQHTYGRGHQDGLRFHLFLLLSGYWQTVTVLGRAGGLKPYT